MRGGAEGDENWREGRLDEKAVGWLAEFKQWHCPDQTGELHDSSLISDGEGRLAEFMG